MEPVEEEYLTGPQVAQQLGVQARTVARWAASGKLRYIQPVPGGHRRYPVSAVRELHRVREDNN